MRTTLAGLGVNLTGVSTADASGLSRENVVPARVVADVIALGGGSARAFNHAMQEMAVAGLQRHLGGPVRRGGRAYRAGCSVARRGR